MTTYLLDTNVILRFFLRDNLPLFNRANQIFKNAENGKTHLVIDSLIIAEVIWVMTSVYAIEKQEVIEKLQQLVSQTWIISPAKQVIIDTLELFETQNLSYIDCYLAIQSKHQKIPLKTFDTKLQNLAKSQA
jgi:predicted nucleic acid-binding protein